MIIIKLIVKTQEIEISCFCINSSCILYSTADDLVMTIAIMIRIWFLNINEFSIFFQHICMSTYCTSKSYSDISDVQNGKLSCNSHLVSYMNLVLH